MKTKHENEKQQKLDKLLEGVLDEWLPYKIELTF